MKVIVTLAVPYEVDVETRMPDVAEAYVRARWDVLKHRAIAAACPPALTAPILSVYADRPTTFDDAVAVERK